jgi:ribosome biogenesis protein MAK21
MNAVVIREITALVLRPPAPAPGTAPATASTGATSTTGKHIRFSSHNPKAKSTPKDAKKNASGGGNAHARYYAAITFNQIVLTPKDREVALQLLDVYFEMFKELLGEGKGDGGNAVELAMPSRDSEKDPRLDKHGRVIESGKGKGKGKIVETKGAAGFMEVQDTYSKLVSAILTGVNRALPFAKIDSGDAR